MLTSELGRIYTALWTLSREADPPVNPVYWDASDMEKDASALFIPPQYDGDDPQIRVARVRPPDDSEDVPPPDLNGASLRELISLAHERGHEQSLREGTYRAMTMEEEQRAWSYAEKLLRALGFQEWPAFHAHKQDSLDEHRRRGTPER